MFLIFSLSQPCLQERKVLEIGWKLCIAFTAGGAYVLLQAAWYLLVPSESSCPWTGVWKFQSVKSGREGSTYGTGSLWSWRTLSESDPCVHVDPWVGGALVMRALGKVTLGVLSKHSTRIFRSNRSITLSLGILGIGSSTPEVEEKQAFSSPF